MAKLLPWVMMPSEWIADGGLKHFIWGPEIGANNVAALMALAPILHHADRESGITRLTYNDLERTTSLSRAKIAAGLEVLEKRSLIEREPEGRSTYKIAEFNSSNGWAKFPALRLYRDGRIPFFNELNLRKRAELDAMKLWYFIAARRDNDDNLAKATYDQITNSTGIPRDRLKTALSLLAANGMVHVEHVPSRHSEYGIANAYRLPQIESSRHMGTVGRGLTEFDGFGGL
jgi:DNA-binding transcriptional ArsR family regulator